MFFGSIIQIAKTLKQSKYLSTDEWKNKMWCIYGMEYYSTIKEVPAICNSIDETWGDNAKWNKSGRDRQILSDLTYT